VNEGRCDSDQSRLWVTTCLSVPPTAGPLYALKRSKRGLNVRSEPYFRRVEASSEGQSLAMSRRPQASSSTQRFGVLEVGDSIAHAEPAVYWREQVGRLGAGGAGTALPASFPQYRAELVGSRSCWRVPANLQRSPLPRSTPFLPLLAAGAVGLGWRRNVTREFHSEFGAKCVMMYHLVTLT
jgi:hypothetical protein